MLSRREVLAGGVVGSFVAAPEAAAAAVEEQGGAQDRELLDRIQRAISTSGSQIARALEGPSLATGPIPKLRQVMEGFLKSNNKFPDFIDVGLGVFFDMYDWHIRHQQQLIVMRQADGRYTMQFMFTMLMLRQEVETTFIGIPYDKV